MVLSLIYLFFALVAFNCVNGAVIESRHHQRRPNNGNFGKSSHNKGPAGSRPPTGTGAAKTGKAVYFLTNQAQNGIVALPIGLDGTIKDGSITNTMGKGATEVDPKTGNPTLPDGLASQGAIRVVNNMVFAVNAGSNSVSMFTIDKNDPTKLQMVGKAVSSGGDFPVTLAVSAKHSLVCAGNTGAKAGVSCATFCEATGLGAFDKLRPFELNQKTPPTGPLNTVSDAFFNEDETAVLTTVKGDPTVNNTGFLSVLPVRNGQVSSQETRSSPNGTAVLFGTVNIPGTGKLFATDASFGAGILDLDTSGKASAQVLTKVEDQKATCWVAISPITKTAFVSDVGVNHLVEMDVTTGAIIKDVELNNGNPGMIDMEAAGSFLYALSPGNGTIPSAITVFDVSGGPGTAKQVQNFNPKGVDLNAQGMAILK